VLSLVIYWPRPFSPDSRRLLDVPLAAVVWPNASSRHGQCPSFSSTITYKRQDLFALASDIFHVAKLVRGCAADTDPLHHFAPCPLLGLRYELRSKFLALPHFPEHYLDPHKAMEDRIPVGIAESDFCRLRVLEGMPELLLVFVPIVVSLRIFRGGIASMSR
jgi:hypothetical protein